MLRPRLVNGRSGDPLLYVELAHEREAVLFDLGDCSALSARDLLRVDHVFVSHMHMDHFIGFDALLRVNVGREKRIVLVGPEGIIDAVGHKLAGYSWDIASRYTTDLIFDVREVHPSGRLRRCSFSFRSRFAREDLGDTVAADGLVVETPVFRVSAQILEHHGPCLAFAIVEPVRINVWRNRVAERGLAVGPWLKALKAAVRDGLPDDSRVMLPDGEQAPLGALRELVSVQAGQKLGYATDIRDTPANRAAVTTLCAEADMMFIEASFAASDLERAFDRAHLTTTAAGEIARAARARRVEPFHFSPRNTAGEDELIAEVEAAFAAAPSPSSV
jgi:ribonuclease Z